MIYHSKRPQWLTMVCECSHVWDAEFVIEHGELINVDSHGEECPECGSESFDIGDEYKSMEWPSPFWILLLIPNLLLFGGVA